MFDDEDRKEVEEYPEYLGIYMNKRMENTMGNFSIRAKPETIFGRYEVGDTITKDDKDYVIVKKNPEGMFFITEDEDGDKYYIAVGKSGITKPFRL